MKVILIITMININMISISYWKGIYNEYRKKTIKAFKEQIIDNNIDNDFKSVLK